MKASLGDHIMIVSNRLDKPVRDGRIVELRHPDGSPPYMVEWNDTGQVGLFFPGPDAVVAHDATPTAPAQAAGGSVKTWHVEVHITESDPDTSATAVLVGEVPKRLQGQGQAHRSEGDAAAPQIGDEVAVARALRRLADSLLGAAGDDIASTEGHPITLRS
jgi:hypothetical protein